MKITKRAKNVVRHFIGKGKKIGGNITSVSIDLDKALPCLHTIKGRKYITFNVAPLDNKKPEGPTFIVYYDEEIEVEINKDD